jgi:hypothetical protein
LGGDSFAAWEKESPLARERSEHRHVHGIGTVRVLIIIAAVPPFGEFFTANAEVEASGVVEERAALLTG